MNRKAAVVSGAATEDPLARTIESSLKVGAACGSIGFLTGGAAGIVRGTTPFLFASASAFQTFALGTTFWGCRSVILHAWTTQHQSPSNLVKASAISGGLTGGLVAFLTRGRANVLPGALMFSLFGSLGQVAYNRFTAPPTIDAEPKPSFWKRMSEKSFSPVTVLSDEQYAEMLREKLLRVDAEIAVLDDKIVALREQQQQQSTDAETAKAKETELER